MNITDSEADDGYLLTLESKYDYFPEECTQKLKLALKKRQIVEEEREKLHKLMQDVRMKRLGTKEKLSGNHMKFFKDEPFIKFYLEVYRELCGRKSIDDITKEVYSRWKNLKRKPRTLRQTLTDPLIKFAPLWNQWTLNGKEWNDLSALKFALMKREIISEEMTRLANFVRNMHKEKKYSMRFLNTYLKVFREMCGKSNSKEIREEAIKRYVTAKQSKSASKTNSVTKKSVHKYFTRYQKKSNEGQNYN